MPKTQALADELRPLLIELAQLIAAAIRDDRSAALPEKETDSATPALMDQEEAGRYLRVAPRSLEDWRYTGKHKIHTKVGGLVRYRKSVFDRWLAEQTRER